MLLKRGNWGNKMVKEHPGIGVFMSNRNEGETKPGMEKGVGMC